ncbi:hypothetical protein [Sphingomonas sp. AOB5]|uniref:hypothetical protein n=1 Tax=Sphingomonas sp. AOB5 TaxID=3034017 RepID=UPI0023F89446|nr:hypothetical protein [Sphingomonas sp. AOB5]
MLLAQGAPLDVPARCRAVALRIERTSNIAVSKLEGYYASEPQAVQDAAFLRRVRELRAAQALAKAIRRAYPGQAYRDAQVDALPWATVIAEGEACRDGTR